MDIKKQCCSLEQALKLRQLGVLQNKAQFIFVSEKETGPWELVLASGYEWSDFPCYAGWPFSIDSFTVAELGVMLPFGYHTVNDRKDGVQVFSAYNWTGLNDPSFVIASSIPEKLSEAVIRAKMLIHLIETGVTTVAEVNERLAS